VSSRHDWAAFLAPKRVWSTVCTYNCEGLEVGERAISQLRQVGRVSLELAAMFFASFQEMREAQPLSTCRAYISRTREARARQ
jgi:hypothetical protein